MFVRSLWHRLIFSYRNLLQVLPVHKASLYTVACSIFISIRLQYLIISWPLTDFCSLSCKVKPPIAVCFCSEVHLHFDAEDLKFGHSHVFKPIRWLYSNDSTAHNNPQLSCISQASRSILLHTQPFLQAKIYLQAHLKAGHFMELSR